MALSSTQARSAEPGDVIAGKYIVESVLGRGGMGVVYEVTHRFTRKRLALKCLLPEHVSNEETVERFVRESQAAGRIQHRHVADIFDVGRDGTILYMLMPLLNGKPLSALFRERTLPFEDLLLILMRALEGVAAAHAEGVLHRDLKPDNIFVCVGPSGRLDDPRVLDFGISKFEDDISQPLTRSGISMGTPYYMSLEQISGNRDLDQRADVYSMGVMLYEAAMGERPYNADTVGGLAVAMVTVPAVPVHERRPDLPRGLCDVIMKAIAVERVMRYTTIGELLDALRPFVTDQEKPKPGSMRPPPPATKSDPHTAPLPQPEFEDTAEMTSPLPQLAVDPALAEASNIRSRWRAQPVSGRVAAALGLIVALIVLSTFLIIRSSRVSTPPPVVQVAPSPPRVPEVRVAPTPPPPAKPTPIVEQRIEAAQTVVPPPAEPTTPPALLPEVVEEKAQDVRDRNRPLRPRRADGVIHEGPSGTPPVIAAEPTPVTKEATAPEANSAPAEAPAAEPPAVETAPGPAAHEAEDPAHLLPEPSAP